MQQRDPYALIRDTASRIRGRARVNVLLQALPPLAASAVLLGLGKLPVEIAAAALVLSGIACLRATSEPSGELLAARRIDQAVEGGDRFLTLATLEPDDRSRFRPLVEGEAADLGARTRAAELVPPFARRRLGWSVALAAILFSAFWFVPTRGSVPLAVTDRLESIAVALEHGSSVDRRNAEAVRSAIQVLRDPARSPAEKRAAAEQAIEKMERQSDRGQGSGQQGGGGETKGEDLHGQAKDELRKAAGEQGSGASAGTRSGGVEEKGEKGETKSGSGGGINGPEKPKGAGEREGESAGNRPGAGEGKSRDARSEGGTPDTGDGARPDEASEGSGESQPRQQAGTGGPGTRASGDESKESERFYEPGEGGDGWRIADGQYVRVRLPDEGGGEETERVAKPGRVAPKVDYRNAPLPSPGKPGEVRESQPVPLEYRNVLGQERRDR